MIGRGVYTLSEVAKYTSVPAQTLRAWFLPRSDAKGRGPIFKSDYAKVGDDFALSFANLVEAYVASFFKRNNVGAADIRKAHARLKSELGEHPFAHAKLSTGLGRIVIEENGKDTRFADVLTRQLYIPEFTDGLLRLAYDPATMMADHWELRAGIIVSPKMGFGKPVIENAGVSTLIVAKQYLANGKNAALVGRLFKIPKESVESAFDFERDLGRIAA